MFGGYHEPIWCWGQTISGEFSLCQYCWCLGSLHHQAISSNGIAVGKAISCLSRGKISNTHAISILKSYQTWKYISIFSQIKWACKAKCDIPVGAQVFSYLDIRFTHNVTTPSSIIDKSSVRVWVRVSIWLRSFLSYLFLIVFYHST